MKNPPDTIYSDAQLDVENAKLRFLHNAEEFSIFSPIDAHPFITIGSMFLLGMGASKLLRNSNNTLSSAIQILGVASQILPLFYKKRP